VRKAGERNARPSGRLPCRPDYTTGGAPAARQQDILLPQFHLLLLCLLLFRSIIQTLGQAGNLARPAPELAEAIDTIADHWCRFEQWNMLPSCFSLKKTMEHAPGV